MRVWSPLLFCQDKIKYGIIMSNRCLVPMGIMDSIALFLLISLKLNIKCRSPPLVSFFETCLDDKEESKEDTLFEIPEEYINSLVA